MFFIFFFNLHRKQCAQEDSWLICRKFQASNGQICLFRDILTLRKKEKLLRMRKKQHTNQQIIKQDQTHNLGKQFVTM